MSEALEPQHRPPSLFYTTVVLFNQVVSITVRPDNEIREQGLSLLEFGPCHRGGRIAIEGDLFRHSALLARLLQEPLGRSNIASFTQEKSMVCPSVSTPR